MYENQPLLNVAEMLKAMRHLSQMDSFLVLTEMFRAYEQERHMLLGQVATLNSQVANLARIATRQQDHMVEMERRDRNLVDFFRATEADHADHGKTLAELLFKAKE